MRLNFVLTVKTAAILWLTTIAASAAAQQAAKVDLSYERFTLDNGLRVIVHEDRKSPIVSVNVTYEVGSKDEPAGKTGFAHLFEHLMFNGSENFDHDFFVGLKEMGAAQYNGTTSIDRTNYFQTVPKSALEQILFLESDRMGHLLGAVTQEKLNTQIGVVKNEKRLGDDRPFGSRIWYEIFENLYPVGHPYHHSTIGSMEDLENASMDDVHEWFRTYYGAANAILVLTGDIDAGEARPLVEKYFGDIPAGPPLLKRTMDSVPLIENKHGVMYDRVSLPRVYRAYVAPPAASKESPSLGIAAQVLGGGKTSRLYRRLVDELQIANYVSVFYEGSLLSGQALIAVDAKSEDALELINKTIDEELAALLEAGPSRNELDRVRSRYFAREILNLEAAISKSIKLADGELLADDPDYFVNEYVDQVAAVTPQQVRAAAGEVFNRGYFELEVLPFPEYQAAAQGYDRSKGFPPRGVPVDLPFPELHERTLSNSVRVFIVPRPTVPLVQLAFQFDAGSAADRVRLPGRKMGPRGLGNMVVDLLDDGTKRLTAQEIAEQQENLGTTIDAFNLGDTTQIRFSALKTQLRPSLTLLSDLIQNASFPENELEKYRKRRIDNLRQQKADIQALGRRALNEAVYGADHPYGNQGTVAEDIASTEAVTLSDLQAWRDAWLQPERAKIFVTGDVTVDTVLPELERAFGKWRGDGGERVAKVIPERSNPTAPRLIVIDKKGTQQSTILAGRLIDPSGGADDAAIDAMNDSFGGSFISRINSNLREDKGWSYGVGSYAGTSVGQRLFTISAPVQIDRTGDAIAELIREMHAVVGERPHTEEELRKTVASVVGSQGVLFESADTILQQMLWNDLIGRPLDHYAGRASRYRALSVDELRAAAKKVIKPEEFTWVIVGDWSKIEDQVQALNMGSIEVRSAGE